MFKQPLDCCLELSLSTEPKESILEKAANASEKNFFSTPFLERDTFYDYLLNYSLLFPLILIYARILEFLTNQETK